MTILERMSKLYLVDQQVRGLRSRLDSADRYLRAQTTALTAVEEREKELLTRKRHHQARIGNLESEGLGMDAQLEKFRNDLNNSETNKQYTAVLTEMNTVKQMRTELDETILQEMAQVEALEAELAEVAEDKAARVKVRDVAAAQFKERESEVGARLAELEKEREEATEGIPARDLALFDELANAYDGEAMAQIEELDRRRREYSCGACQLQIPFERVSILMSPGTNETLVTCSSCRRILVLGETMKTALTPK